MTGIRGRLVAVGAVVALLGGASACGGEDAPAPAATEQPSATTVEPEVRGDTRRLPYLVGKGLQTAQDTAQAAGFHILSSHDATGRGRRQVLDRNWKVCAQHPRAGEVPADTEIEFAVVKLDERCPAKRPKRGAPKVGKVMLNFVGKSVRAVRDALPFNAGIDRRDASGRDRAIFLETNWKVCSHKPKAGERYSGQPVVVNAVKYGERCR